MSKPAKEDGLYAPRGNESGTDFVYRKLARKGCKVCKGHGEWHVPYEDYDTYIIHRCDCSRADEAQAVAEPKPVVEFTECATCAAKPGSPALCVACCANRELISTLGRKVEELEEIIASRVGADHFGRFGAVCMNTGQFDAGECWLCYAKRKKREAAEMQLVAGRFQYMHEQAQTCINAIDDMFEYRHKYSTYNQLQEDVRKHLATYTEAVSKVNA